MLNIPIQLLLRPLRRGAIDNGPSIGYTAFLADPDGNSLELSYWQCSFS